MEEKSLLKILYQELKEYIEDKKTKDDIEINEMDEKEELKQICEESFEELLEEYKRKYKTLQTEKTNIKKRKMKKLQKEKLANYCKSMYSFELSLDEHKDDLNIKEKEIERELKEVEDILKLLTGKSPFKDGIVEEIKYLKLY